jgi:nitrate/TMAO reductase-like tetraheme cytochrome c subunit
MSPKPEQINNEQKPKKLFKNLSKKQIIFLLLIVLAFVGLGGLAVVKASDNPAFCSTTCHNMKPQYNSYQNSNSNLLAYKHAKAKIVCHDCHQDSLTTKAQEGVKYVTGNYEDPMKTRTFSKEMCLKCHDWKKVQKETASLGTKANENPHNSEHGGQRECSTCHKVHEQSTNGCLKCHGASWANKLDNSWKKK